MLEERPELAVGDCDRWLMLEVPSEATGRLPPSVFTPRRLPIEVDSIRDCWDGWELQDEGIDRASRPKIEAETAGRWFIAPSGAPCVVN